MTNEFEDPESERPQGPAEGDERDERDARDGDEGSGSEVAGGPPDGPMSPRETQRFVRAALVFYGVMGCIALVWRMSTPGQSILHPSPEAAAGAMGWLPAIGLGGLIGILALGLSEALTRWTRLGDALADHLGRSLAGIGLGDACLLALASGLAEELLFRGALQPVVGLVWASLIFGACHFVPRRELWPWSVFAVVMGLLLGALYDWTGHLAAPIAAHTVVNGVNLPRLARRGVERSRES